jgi:hypothetical protein
MLHETADNEVCRVGHGKVIKSPRPKKRASKTLEGANSLLTGRLFPFLAMARQAMVFGSFRVHIPWLPGAGESLPGLTG